MEIVRDPIAENYFYNLSNNDENFQSYIVFDSKPNAFVIENNIYFTTELIKLIKDEDTLKSIYFHELGHIEHNHYASKKIKVLDAKKSNSLNNLLSLGLAVISGDPSIGIASSLAINQQLLSDLSYNSIKFEIQADDFMISKIKERNLNTKGLINFIEELPKNQNAYFATHPRNEDRINILKNLSRKESVNSSPEFSWIKAKYGKNSKIDDFNEFFINLEKGIVSQIEENSIPNAYLNYEMYKKGISRLKNEEMFQELYSINDNSFLKIEYFNYIIDNQLSDLYILIEKNKENKEIQYSSKKAEDGKVDVDKANLCDEDGDMTIKLGLTESIEYITEDNLTKKDIRNSDNHEIRETQSDGRNYDWLIKKLLIIRFYMLQSL